MKSVAIGENVKPIRTWNPAREGEGRTFRYIDISSVSQEDKAITASAEMPSFDAPSRARQLVEFGDVLVSTVRPNLNAVALVDAGLDGATASTGFCVLRADEVHLHSRYLFQWVRSPQFVAEMVKLATGQSYPAVSDKIVKDNQIPLPPVPEQKRIAAILDQADSLRRLRQRAIDRLNSLGQAIFYEMFGEQDDEGLGERLGDHATKIGSGATPTGGDSAYQKSGIPFVRSMNVRDGYFDPSGLAFLNEQQAKKLDNVALRENDVLLNITGASVARVCRAPESVASGRVNQHVSIIRVSNSIKPEFLEAFLLFPKTKQRLLAIADSGATRQAITKAQIEELTVPVRPVTQQTEFVKRKRAAIRIQQSASLQAARMDSLFASLQTRAFRGEL